MSSILAGAAVQGCKALKIIHFCEGLGSWFGEGEREGGERGKEGER